MHHAVSIRYLCQNQCNHNRRYGQSMPKISVCIISFNEEDKIEDCLKSVQSVADEIVVVDSNSTDMTVEIARRYTEQVHIQEFLGYMRQKDFAVTKASHDWILSLDCDERLSPELARAILDEKDALGRFDAYKMARKTFYVYRWLNHCWYPDFKVRLFDRRKTRWGGVNLHEKILVEEGVVDTLAGDILHYSYDSLSDHIKTIDRFTDIAAQEIIDEGRRVSVLTPLVRANATFIKIYFLRLGFLDGFAGLAVAVLSFMHVFVKYGKVLTHQRKH